ncbi:MAG: adenine deaminase [Firmicutes bacterium]|nr:adenine deaminase [Bacillota bacterium]
MYKIKRRPLSELTAELAAAAQGKFKADTVIKGGKVVNVFTAEIITADVAIYSGRIVLVGQADHTIGPDTRIIDASGFYLVPGLLDGHIHVESSMVSVTQFARAVVPRGTTTIFMDPHEIANVLGMRGIKLMVEEGRNLPLKVFSTMPSCVPAAPGFEDAGAVIGPQEVAEAMAWEGIIGLGEMMNFPGVLNGDPGVHGELKATLEANKVITGHYSIPETEVGLQAYAASGIASCHEGTRAEDALARLRLGMYAKLREGSAWHDIKATVKSITEYNIDSRRAVLVTDDTHPNTLLTVGHLNHVVRRAIEEGVNPIRAIQMATLNPAECFGVSRDLGSIAPGRYADILFVRDLAEFEPAKVMTDGEIVAEDGQLLVDVPSYPYPEWVRDSVHIKDSLTAADFLIPSPIETGLVEVRVIEIIEAKVGTLSRTAQVKARLGKLYADPGQDLAKVASIERHHGSGTIGLGYVRGFGFEQGAVASTVGHDSHNLLIVGTNEDDMAVAGNALVACGGGMVAVRNGEVLALLPLPIAGLMSPEPVEKVGEQVQALEAAFRELGCQLVSPFMTMALLPLAVLPELRITNRGLVDTVNFKLVDVVLASGK